MRGDGGHLPLDKSKKRNRKQLLPLAAWEGRPLPIHSPPISHFKHAPSHPPTFLAAAGFAALGLAATFLAPSAFGAFAFFGAACEGEGVRARCMGAGSMMSHSPTTCPQTTNPHTHTHAHALTFFFAPSTFAALGLVTFLAAGLTTFFFTTFTGKGECHTSEVATQLHGE